MLTTLIILTATPIVVMGLMLAVECGRLIESRARLARAEEEVAAAIERASAVSAE
jgi:hypothetical protein